VIRTDVAAAERALEIIAETSRKALAQTRSMLGLLRAEDADPAVSPLQGIDDLEDLVHDVREAGVDVSLTVSGAVRPLDTAIELTAYRIVQESLTNVLKHSGARQAQVTVAYVPDGVDVEVRDHGHGGSRASSGVDVPGGHGLVGLRERARLLGGTLDYGALDGAGFRVAAHLPSSMAVAP